MLRTIACPVIVVGDAALDGANVVVVVVGGGGGGGGSGGVALDGGECHLDLGRSLKGWPQIGEIKFLAKTGRCLFFYENNFVAQYWLVFLYQYLFFWVNLFDECFSRRSMQKLLLMTRDKLFFN